MANEAKEAIAPVDELLEVGERMKRDKARLVELCRLIAVSSDAWCEAPVNAVNAVNAVPNPTDAGDVLKTGGKQRLPGNAQYWKKVTCPVCRQEKGSRTYEGQRYPVLHPNPETGEKCKGSFQAVEQAE